VIIDEKTNIISKHNKELDKILNKRNS